MTAPNFFIPGAQKSGTTTLYQLLRQHPDCFLTECKEPQQLATPHYQRARYLQLFANAHQQRAVGDASTSYLVVPGVAERIRQEFGADLRFIFILRAPLERILSGYLHMYKRDHERRDWNRLFAPLPEDEQAALAQEQAGCEAAEQAGEIVTAPYRAEYGAHRLWNFRYLHGTLYSRLIAPYLRLFGRERCHITTLDQLQRDPAATLAAIFRFLGLEADFRPSDLGVICNATHLPHSPPPLSAASRAALIRLLAAERERCAELLGGLPPSW